VEDELTAMTARQLADLIKAGRVSPVEVVQACLDRTEALDPILHAFITVAPDAALRAARQAEKTLLRGDDLGPLHGVPIALKDEAWTAGMPATAGSLLFKKFIPTRHGTVSERLERAGAILIGKTNLPEFAAWPRSKNRVAGECVNPWDVARISGASSGGSAAAVAAGLVPAAIGSDGGGSIRIPSSLCGVSGLFPTPGRVPGYGSFTYSPLGSLGPMAKDVGDLALLQQLIAGPDPRDGAARLDRPPDLLVEMEAGIEGLRLAWSPDFGRISIDRRVAEAARSFLDRAAAAGAAVDEITDRLEHPWGDGSFFAARQASVGTDEWSLDDASDIPDISREEWWMWDVFAGTVPLTATNRFQSLCRRYRHLLTPPSQQTYDPDASRGEMPDPGPDMASLKASIQAVLARFDVICSPTMPTIAPLIPPGWASPYADPYFGTNYTFIANSTGCPAASIPCGLVDGLPVGLQVIGRPGDEGTVLRVCHALEAGAPPFPRPPVNVPSPAT
jgi:Asp-tRNA(Asn)/Glu-tRNA(Gln) amidotransferase A subunit family amidase